MTEALSYRNQSIDLQSKSKDWFLYDNGFRHERVKWIDNCVNVKGKHGFYFLINVFDKMKTKSRG